MARRGRDAEPGLHVVVANPSCDVYGSDLQMLESGRALVAAGHRVTVLVPSDGPLRPRLEAVGIAVEFVRFPVLRRANAGLREFLGMALAAARSIPTGVRALRRRRADVLYVNTVTLPWWLGVGRIARTPTLCHVHEAETQDRMLVRRALIVPLHLAQRLIIISQAVLTATCETSPTLRSRCRLVYNGVPSPTTPAEPAATDAPHQLVVVGRLSPRKGTDLALEVTAELVRRGRDVELEVAGSCFPGYEDFEASLRERAHRPDLAGRVTFSGYCSPIWPVFARNQVVLAPSLREPFGNAVVEAQLSRRPVVASDELGHKESISHLETGLLVPVGEVLPMADAVEGLLDDPAERLALGDRAEHSARTRFGTARYDEQIVRTMTQLAALRR